MFVGDSHDDGGPNGVDIVATRCLTEVHNIATMVDGLAGRGGDCPLAELETRFLQLCQLGNCTPAETKTILMTMTMMMVTIMMMLTRKTNLPSL